MIEQGGLKGTSKVPASLRNRLSLTREVKLGWKVCLHPYLEQGGTPSVEKSKGPGSCFFSLTDGNYSKFHTHTLGLFPEKLG